MFKVIKRDGSTEEFKLHKLEKVISFVTQDLNIDMEKFKKQFSFTFKDNITTKELHQNLIKAALECSFDPDTETIYKEFDIMANRLLLMNFWKEMKIQRESEGYLTDDIGMFKSAADWIKHLEKFVELKVYDERILKINKDILKKLYVLAKKANQEFDNYSFPHFMWNNAYYQTMKFMKSYLIKYENKPIETFEEALLLISILGFYEDYKKDKDLFLNNIKDFYMHLINYHFVPATPQLLNLRRRNGNLSSCNILNIYDNINSIFYSAWQVAKILQNAGGVGIAPQMRVSSSWLRNNFGNANHIQIWMKLFNDIAVAVNQGGMRPGAITDAIPIWHKDVLEFAKSKTPLGEARFKTFNLFPQVIVQDEFIKRLRKREDWYLFDSYEIERELEVNLYNLWGEEFSKYYNKAIDLAEEGKIKNYIKINTVRLAAEIMQAITSSGLPYLVFEDNINKFSNFKEKIYSANLCVESFSPFRNTNPENYKPGDEIPEEEIGYVHSCNLFSINLPRLYESKILFDDEKLSKAMDLVVRYMDNILEVANPPIKEIKKHNRLFRTIGIGYLGFADLAVKLSIDENKLYTYKWTYKSAGDADKYNEYKQSMLDLVKRVFGRIAFYTIKASVNLAKERGVPEKYHETKWKDGVILGQTKLEYEINGESINVLNIKEIAEYFNINNIGEANLVFTDLMKYGIRNTMLLNCPPNTSTAIYAGVSASIFPIYNIIQQETQKTGNYIIYPRYIDYRLYYDTYKSWRYEDVDDIIDFVSAVQKYIDSGISFEYPVNLNTIKRDEIPNYLTRFFVIAPEKGIKALYYGRTIHTQGNTEKEECSSCAN